MSAFETLELVGAAALHRLRYRVVRRVERAVAARLQQCGLRVLPCAANREPPPSCDEAWLQRQYEAQGLVAMPDTYVLYRIIGNDLVPRHAHGQSRANVRFILENEPRLDHCEKRWIVNRIADAREEAAICRLLESHGQHYIRIPFEHAAYDREGWDFSALPEPGWSWRERDYGATRDVIKGIEYRLYRHRNNYAIHNNGARNAALRDGRQRAKWILPWDGNCFVTERAWQEIREGIENRPWYPYFLVPMARMTANADLLRSAFRPHAEEEPQIVFRNDAREMFDEAHPYGRRPKVELLWRLGVPGPWDCWRIEPWDLPCPDYAREAGQFLWVGWVARLFSGQAHLEAASRRSMSQRRKTRANAVLEHLMRLDREALRGRFDAERLHAYAEAMPAPGDSGVVSAGGDGRATLIRSADALLNGDLDQPEDHGCEPLDRLWRQPSFGAVTLCALAWRLTGHQAYAGHAARVLDRTFAGRRPDAGIGSRDAKGSRKSACLQPATCVEATELHGFLDAVRLIRRANALESVTATALTAWLAARQQALTASIPGRIESRRRDHRGTYHELHRATIAAYLDDERTLIDALRNARERLLQQFDAEGRQPAEPQRVGYLHYRCLNLQGWVHLATLAGAVGEDLWNFTGHDGRGLQAGLRRLFADHAECTLDHRAETLDGRRLEALYHACLGAYGHEPIPGQGAIAHKSSEPPNHAHFGFLPLWMLGRAEATRQGGLAAVDRDRKRAIPAAGMVEMR